MTSGALVFNGIDGETGAYLIPPMPPEEIWQVARGRVTEPGHLRELRWWHHRVAEASFGPKEGVDPKRLDQTGWGVIFAHDDDPRVREALRPLLEHRQRAAARVREHRYREFAGEHAYRPQESKPDFLARQGAGPGPADPEKVPYYLLIVGDAHSIPYSFQYQLDVQYAVGRIHFETLDEYTHYAESVVAAEVDGVDLPRRAVFVGSSHPGDRATELSASQLVIPLAERLRKDAGEWEVSSGNVEDATKEALLGFLGGDDTPALLFTATHGMGLPNGHPRQLRHQGALVCQDWPGPERWHEALDERHYVSCDDIGDQAELRGLISFHFACFGAGTPAWDDFGHGAANGRRALAPRPFVAGLPKRLLSHPNGAALAVVGHVDRAWGYSFVWPQAGRQTEVYESCLARLMDGHPIGSAFEYLNERYAELSADLSVALEDIEFGKVPDPLELSGMWTATNDARGFAILGDPAVRLRGRPEPVTAPAPRPILESPPPPGPPPRAAPVPDPPQAPPAEGAPLEYGMFDDVRQVRERLHGALRNVADTLGSALERAIENVTVLEVATYVGDDLSAVSYDSRSKRFEGGARLRALSRVGVDGDTALLVPEASEDVDERLWSQHLAMVEQARAARQDLLKTATAAVAGLLDATKAL